MTENYLDALNILKGKEGFVYEYELCLEGLKIKSFLNDEEVFNYIFENRTRKIIDKEFDIVIGKTASGNCSKIFKEIRNKGIIVDKRNLSKKMLDDNYGEQICIKTEKGLSKLSLVDVYHYNDDYEIMDIGRVSFNA